MIDAALVLLSCALLLSTGAACPEPASGAAQGELRAANGNRTTADDARRFSGTVVQPDGSPMSGAHVIFERVDLTDLVELKATTDDRGRFDFSIPADQILNPLGTRIVALKPGFGPAWLDPDTQQNFTDIRLRLALDDLPIEGRILTLEGGSVVGATVRAIGIQLFANDDPQPYLAVLKASDGRATNYRVLSWLRLVPFGDRSPSARSLFGNPDAEHPAVATARTDERGAFRLTGIGRHRRAVLAISGNAIANTTIEVLTDPFEGLLNGKPPRSTKPTYGARFVHHVRPSRPIVGTVTDAQTGRPIPGAQVGHVGGYSQTISDAAGRFELPGCAKDKKYELSAGFSLQPSTYIAGYFDIDDAPGLEPLQVQLHVFPAIPLSGHVIDRVTGKPVSAQVFYWPVYPNTHVVRGMPVGGACSETLTKRDGSFSVCVLPGPGALLVRAAAGGKFEPAWADAQAFFASQRVRYGSADIGGATKDTLFAAAGPGGVAPLLQSNFQGIALLNVPETALRLTQDIDVRSKTKSGGL
jgi:hypothetical protein